jgi:hypothetical protein
MNKEGKFRIAIEFIKCIREQTEIEENFSRQLQQLHPKNRPIFSFTHQNLINNYHELLREVIGSKNFDWVKFWIYDTYFGKYPIFFSISVNDKEPYIANQYTTEQFLELVWVDNE